jgi:iron complex transport system ATP-binding protein
VLHEITMALHADEMVVMDAGRVVHQGACVEPSTHRALEKVFAGRVRVREIDGRPVALPDETTPDP